MAHVHYVDELIREYLLYRGFSGTLKTFDSELKVDRDKGFRADKIVDQLNQHVYAYDLISLKELWSHLDQRMFSKLEHHFIPAVKKLENALLKLYVVNATANGKTDKVNEFFMKLTPELVGQLEWKDWFVLPWIKNPEENPTFAIHFTRHWQDTLFVSLNNFLATVFQVMPIPTLINYEKDAIHIKKLQEENEALKARLANFLEVARSNMTSLSDLVPPEVPQQPELMDDFCIIATESASTVSESHTKSLKYLIRNIGSGMPTSPILVRKSSSQPSGSGKVKSSNISGEEQMKKHAGQSGKQRLSSSLSTANKSQSNEGSKRHLLAVVSDPSSVRHTRDQSAEPSDKKAKPELQQSQPLSSQVGSAVANSGLFLLLSQDEYNEHRAPICHTRFNNSGSMVVSADIDGVIKLWTTTPLPKTLATYVSKSSILSLDWIPKNERYLVTGNKQGLMRLYDTKENRVVWEFGTEPSSPLKDTRILTVRCSPGESSFITSVAPNTSSAGKLLVFDIKTRKLERSLNLDIKSGVMANCCTFNHNGQLLVAGCNDGVIRIFDLRRSEIIDQWIAHHGSILEIQLISDFTTCATLGEDGKLCQRSLNQSGQSLWEVQLQDSTYFKGIAAPYGQLFTFNPTGTHVLTCGNTGGNIYQITGTSVTRVLELGGHKSPVRAVDWTIANQCATCVTGCTGDGKIKVSTLLIP